MLGILMESDIAAAVEVKGNVDCKGKSLTSGQVQAFLGWQDRLFSPFGTCDSPTSM